MILVTGWQVEHSSNSNGVGGKMEGDFSTEGFYLWVGSYFLSLLVENNDMTQQSQCTTLHYSSAHSQQTVSSAGNLHAAGAEYQRWKDTPGSRRVSSNAGFPFRPSSR